LSLIKQFIQKILGYFEGLLFGKALLFVPRSNLKVGGPTSFMALLLKRLNEKGIRVTRNRFADAEVALIPISMDSDCLAQWRSHSAKRRVYQRLDGVFYDPEKSDYDENRNCQLKRIYHELADVHIFQSLYSQKQCIHFLGEAPRNQPSSVIYNGTDLNCFSVYEGHKMDPSNIRFVTTGNFRDPDMLLPILSSLDRLQDTFNFTLEVVGPISENLGVSLDSYRYVRQHGSCDRATLAEVLKQSDIFLFSFLNPNCPNSVIEATSCGLPVVSFNTGAMMELCGFNSELLVEMTTVDPVIHKRSELMQADRFLDEKIIECIEGYDVFRARAIAAREKFDINLVVDAYLNTIFPVS